MPFAIFSISYGYTMSGHVLDDARDFFRILRLAVSLRFCLTHCPVFRCRSAIRCPDTFYTLSEIFPGLSVFVRSAVSLMVLPVALPSYRCFQPTVVLYDV